MVHVDYATRRPHSRIFASPGHRETSRMAQPIDGWLQASKQLHVPKAQGGQSKNQCCVDLPAVGAGAACRSRTVARAPRLHEISTAPRRRGGRRDGRRRAPHETAAVSVFGWPRGPYLGKDTLKPASDRARTTSQPWYVAPSSQAPRRGAERARSPLSGEEGR